MRKILLFALVLRLLLAPLVHHSDALDALNWGKNLENFGLAGFYLRDTPDAGPPNYPPGFYYVLTANQILYNATRQVLWTINLAIPPFPSNLYTWFESDKGRIFFNKLPAIFADLGIGYLIYLLVSQMKNKKIGLVSSSVFLFSPPIWYNSAAWGQTESLFALPLLASFYGLYKKKYILAPLLFLLGFLIKPTILLVLPVFLIWWLRNSDKKSVVKGVILGAVLFYLVHVPFHPQGTFGWLSWLYRHGIREVLGYLTANAFNLWGLFFGFEVKLDSTLLLGVPARIWGFTIFGAFAIYFFNAIKKRQNVRIYFFVAALLSLAGFLFLTRIHERYFYLVLLTLAPLVGLDEKIKKVFIILSGAHLINLYHHWWVPRIVLLMEFFSTRIVEQALTLINFAIFFSLIILFKRRYLKI